MEDKNNNDGNSSANGLNLFNALNTVIDTYPDSNSLAEAIALPFAE